MVRPAGPPIFYYRDKDGGEIDLLFDYDGSLYPVEIKLGANPGKEWLRHFHALERFQRPIGRGAVINLYPEVIPLDKNNDAIPAGSL